MIHSTSYKQTKIIICYWKVTNKEKKKKSTKVASSPGLDGSFSPTKMAGLFGKLIFPKKLLRSEGE